MPPRRFPPPWSVEELDACFVVTDSVVKPCTSMVRPRGQYQIESRIEKTPALRLGSFLRKQTRRLAGFSWIGKAPDSRGYFGAATILNLYRIAHSESTVG